MLKNVYGFTCIVMQEASDALGKLQTVTLFRPNRSSYWSPTALKRPDRSKQCNCLQFAKFMALLSNNTMHMENN